MRAIARIILFTCLLTLTSISSKALSFNLDSIATWGKFPRFCVNTYRWGDVFFNGYDTTYVAPTGYKFNAKITSNTWSDIYNFKIGPKTNMFMTSNTSVSAGVYVTYLAVSAGYDISLNKLFGGQAPARKRWRFGFNCMLFAAEAYYIDNNEGARLRRFGDLSNLSIPVSNINNTSWGLDAYYFFNHKRYSEAATFNYSRIQRKSQGAFFTGFSIYTQKLDFNFRELPPDMLTFLPGHWDDYHYNLHTHNYALRFGYGYNLVLPRGWVIGVSESPTIGIRKGYINSDYTKVAFSMYNHFKVAVVWNSGRWFFGANGRFDLAIVNNKSITYAGANLTGEAVFGCRFNIW